MKKKGSRCDYINEPQYLLVNTETARVMNMQFGVSSECTQSEQKEFGVSTESNQMNTKQRIPVLVCHASATKSDTKCVDTYYIEKDNIKTYKDSKDNKDKEEKEKREEAGTTTAIVEEEYSK